MVLTNFTLSQVYFAASTTTGSSYTQTKKTDGRVNNGRNLTQADRSRGGVEAHRRGTAHRFTPIEARAAGRIGGRKRRKRLISNNEN
ncbi:MAG: hypothetical protein AAGF07_05110 [Patescibacteria group bacterium]